MKPHRGFISPYSRPCILAVIATSLLSDTSFARPAYRFDWQQQFGTAYFDGLADVAVDGFGYVFVSGHSEGIFGSAAEAFLRKYDAAGNEIWTRQYTIIPPDDFGSSFASGVATDGDGYAYVSGIYNSVVGDCCNFDPYLRKYDQDGYLLWTESLPSDSSEETAKVAADGLGNIFLAGSRSQYPGSSINGYTDAYVAKYSTAGDLLWHRQFGGSGEDQVIDIAIDGLGNVFLTGFQELSGSMGASYDAFVTKFDAAGNELWTSLLGEEIAFELAFGIDVTADGTIILVGQTDSDFGSDAPSTFSNVPFVVGLDNMGQLQWVDVSDGGNVTGRATDVVVDDTGTVHVAGYLTDFEGTDAFLRKYSTSGELLGYLTIGAEDYAALSAIDTNGQVVYAVGGTRDSLFAPALGDSDAIVMRLTPVPEPCVAWLLASAAVSLASIHARISSC